MSQKQGMTNTVKRSAHLKDTHFKMQTLGRGNRNTSQASMLASRGPNLGWLPVEGRKGKGEGGQDQNNGEEYEKFSIGRWVLSGLTLMTYN